MAQDLQNLMARPGARSAARNFCWLVADRSVRLLLNLGVGLWVARYLGPERLGRLSYVVALVTLANFIPQLGLDAVLKREWLRQPTRAAEWLSSAWVLRLIAGIGTGMTLAVVAWSGWGLSAEEIRLLAVLAAPYDYARARAADVAEYRVPAPDGGEAYRTFCGT